MDAFICLHITPGQAFIWFVKLAQGQNKGYLVEQVENGGYGSDLAKVMELAHLLGINVRIDHFLEERKKEDDIHDYPTGGDSGAKDTRFRRRYLRRI